MTSISSISFHGSLMGVGTNCGYGYAAVELIESWQRQGTAVWWAKEDCPVAFSMCQPNFYSFDRSDQFKIGYTPWESTRVPDGWIDDMSQMDEIWTTSEACKQWYIDAGLKLPIRVLHHGINRSHFPLKMRKLSKDQPYTFLHIGAEAKRKGALLAYECFKDSFGDDPSKHLILKGFPSFKVIGSNVTVIQEYLTQKDLTALYLSCHAMVYPTNGEGFGLIPFQAAATGMPTLCTNWGGCKDYIKYCWPIDPQKEIECDYEPHQGKWADPSYDDLKLWMEYFADSPDFFFHRAFRHGSSMTEHFSWDFLAKKSLSWIKESLVTRCQ